MPAPTSSIIPHRRRLKQGSRGAGTEMAGKAIYCTQSATCARPCARIFMTGYMTGYQLLSWLMGLHSV